MQKLSSTLSLSAWVTLGVMLSVLLTTASVWMVVNQFARSYAYDQAQTRLHQLAWQMQDALDRNLQERYHDIKILSMRSPVREATDANRIRAIFNELQKSVPQYAWIGFAKPDGKVMAASQGLLEGHSVAQRPWFQNALKNFYAGDDHPAVRLATPLPATSEPWRFVDIATPIFSSDGRYQGVLGLHLNGSWARELAKNLVNPADDRDETEIAIVRPDGTVLLGPKEIKQQQIASDSFMASLRQPSGAMRERVAHGDIYITGFARTSVSNKLPDLQWTVLVRQKEQVAMAGVKELKMQVLVVGGLVGALLTIAAYCLSRRLVAPMNTLSAALERRAAGPNDVVMPIVSTYSEIQWLSRTLAAMVQREVQQQHQLQTLNDGLERRVAQRYHETAIALQQALDSQREQQIRLEERENELRAILQNAHDAFIAIDENGLILEWNYQAEQLLGWSRAEALQQAMAELIIPPDQRERHRRGLKHFLTTGTGVMINNRVEIHALRRDGHRLPVEVTVGHVQRRAGHLFIAFLHDITERQAFRDSLQEMALSDILTGLPNRRAFTEKLPEAMARAKRESHKMGLLFMDIDGFKGINDQYGHEGGDELLIQFAARLQQSVRDVDTVARLAGDEFTVILERLHSPEDALAVAEKIVLAMRLPFVLSVATVQVSSSIGVAIFEPEMHIGQDELLAQADKAMYAAKKAGKNRVTWSREPGPG